MQQRRVRLGDVVDDYCPRERRITNHAVVAMIDDEVKQTRCSTCDAEHEYKEARVPPPRRRKSPGALSSDPPEALVRPRPPDTSDVDPPDDDAGADLVRDEPEAPATDDASMLAEGNEPVADEDRQEAPQDEWVHRPLIRATLPRQEGQTPERKAPDFTHRQPRFDNNRNGQRPRGQRQGRPHQGAQRQAQGQPGPSSRFSRPGGNGPQGNRQGPGGGNRHGSGHSPQGQHGSRPAGQPRGPRHGSGSGRKRGR